MQHKPATLNRNLGGPAAATAADVLREKIASGEYLAGQFLPSVRRLSSELGHAPQTIHRAVKRLAAEGLVRPDSSRGYLVMPGANDPLHGCPVAYAFSGTLDSGQDPFHTALRTEIEAAAARRGWSFLSVGGSTMTPTEIVQRLKAQRAFATCLDTHDPDFVRMVREAGIIPILVDGWVEGAEMDSVMQDGQQGGAQAARYLLSKGRRRIAWLGRKNAGSHGPDRLSGALVTLRAAGIRLPDRLLAQVEPEDAARAARKLLSGKDVPDGVLALWDTHAKAVLGAAAELGLKTGRDLDVVGWGAREALEANYGAVLRDAPGLRIVTWRIREMAQAVMSRLAERRANPEMPPLRVKVPTTLQPSK